VRSSTELPSLTQTLSNPHSCFVATIVRIIYMLRLDLSGDMTYTSLQIFFWSFLEPCWATFAISLPMLIPFYLKHRRGRLNNNNNNNGNQPVEMNPRPGVLGPRAGPGGDLPTIGGSGGKKNKSSKKSSDPYRIDTLVSAKPISTFTDFTASTQRSESQTHLARSSDDGDAPATSTVVVVANPPVTPPDHDVGARDWARS
jgi:hypothetical protein